MGGRGDGREGRWGGIVLVSARESTKHDTGEGEGMRGRGGAYRGETAHDCNGSERLRVPPSEWIRHHPSAHDDCWYGCCSCRYPPQHPSRPWLKRRRKKWRTKRTRTMRKRTRRRRLQRWVHPHEPHPLLPFPAPPSPTHILALDLVRQLQPGLPPALQWSSPPVQLSLIRHPDEMIRPNEPLQATTV